MFFSVQYLPLPNVTIPANSTKIGYGTVQMKYVRLALVQSQIKTIFFSNFSYDKNSMCR